MPNTLTPREYRAWETRTKRALRALHPSLEVTTMTAAVRGRLDIEDESTRAIVRDFFAGKIISEVYDDITEDANCVMPEGCNGWEFHVSTTVRRGTKNERVFRFVLGTARSNENASVLLYYFRLVP